MSFNGYLMEMGGQRFPHKYIYKESYKVTPSARLDLDPFRNTEGWLMRSKADVECGTRADVGVYPFALCYTT